MINKLAVACLQGNFERSHKDDIKSKKYGDTSVYAVEVEGVDERLLFWNNSNHNGFDEEDALKKIAQELLEGNEQGEVDCSTSWNIIGFEIK